jgi:glycosyltransferase involved in cell wall biosynthesis
MKIAIFHNFMDNIGGAEYVDLILARELNADIYTTNIDKEKIEKMGFSTKNIYSIGKIPINAPFRQEFAYWKFRKLDLGNKYDFYIIAGDWAMSAAINNKPNFWYVYSPKREIWDLHDYVRNKMASWWKRPIFDVWVIIRRIMDKNDCKKIKNIISISKNVQDRIKKYLNRDSTVIYPPTETKKYKFKRFGDYWLSVNRLLDQKRVDMQIKAFEKLPNKKLIIIGSYEKSKDFLRYVNYINKIKPVNVEIKSWVSQKELISLYANCKGFITTSKNEDYGMTPVEAMASGKPVIAPNEGGYKETITKNTGILIDDIDENKLVDSITEIERWIKKNPKKIRNACIKQAKKFDAKVFIKKMKEEIENNKNGKR